MSNNQWRNWELCQCSLDDPQNAYCPFPGKDIFNAQFILFRKAAELSHLCHPDVLNKKIFHEWESCMGDVELLEAYKDAYRQSKLWGIMQNTDKNKDAAECFNQISPVRKREQKIYVKPEKMKQFKKTEEVTPIFYISKYLNSALRQGVSLIVVSVYVYN